MIEPAPKLLPARRVAPIVGGMFALLFGAALLPRSLATPGLWGAIVGAGGVLSIAAFVLWRRQRGLEIELWVRRPHYVQLVVQLGVFAYWGYAWRTVYTQFPLILTQVVLAYLVELILSWRRYGRWRLGFGPFPIVFSVNIFIWFEDHLFICQLAMVALAYLSRDLIRWRRNGRLVHIFNPSAFGLAVAAIALVFGEWAHLTYGNRIAITLGHPDFSYEWIFLMGITVQLFFHVTLITASAAVTSWLLGMVYVAVTGDYMYVDTAIPIAVFLGMNLLVTDPASSPQSNGGKILFGAVYAVAVFFTYDVLRDLSRPPAGDDPGFYVTWLDKLLFLPFLNLAVPLIDAIGRRLTLRRWWTLDARRTNWIHVGAWVVFFGCMLGDLRDSPGKNVTFWAPKCEAGEVRACENIVSLYRQDCEGEIGASCHNLGVMFEHGDEVAEDVSLAAGAYFKGCEFAFAPACRHLGVLIWTGRALDCGADAGCDDKGAAALFARACELGDPGGCTQYGVSLTLGRGVVADPSKAATQFQRACDGGHGPGCAQLGNARLTGRGVSQDKVAAARLYDKACAVGEDVACTNLAAMKWLGDGVPVDREGARRGLDAACGRGFAPACAQRERLLRGPPR